ncbi:MAG TPA: glycosyltransferase [Gaiellaceae bacterium]|jgi:GT2 family glycosyltransferase|nr:glycosyltransferase [Gaiellaceae bacterium]
MSRFLAPPPERQLEPGPPPRFSVLVPAYNAAATIAEAVESALGQTAPPHEVIVCDDGSTDDLEGALAPYRDRIVLVHKENGGGASALNAAAAGASGDFLVVLDSDDAYLPTRLEAMGALASARPDLDVLSTDALLEVDGRAVARFYTGAQPFPAGRQREAILDRCFLFAPAVRRDRLERIGGWDESIPIAYDWDCWLRLVLDGCAVGIVDEPLVRYRLRHGSLASRRAAALRDRVVVLEKARSHPTLTRTERRLLEHSLRVKRRRALLAEAEAAVRGGDGARRSTLALAAAPGLPLATRAKALAAALFPAAARRRLEAREAQTGRSRLERPVPDGE